MTTDVDGAIVAPAPDAGDPVRVKGRMWRRMRRNPLSLVGAGLALTLILMGVFAPLVAPAGYGGLHLKDALVAPGSAHLLGSDQFGRDLLARIVYGARISLLVGLSSTAVAAVGGTLLGLVAGYFGGWIDEVLMRAMDVILSFPQIVLAIALAAIVGPSLTNVIFVVGVLSIPQFARVTRGSVLLIREMDYIVAARTIGHGELFILRRHVLPNAVGPLVVLTSLTIPSAILSETALSFLGMGIDPTGVPSWGSLLADGRNFMIQAPWIATFPGIAITLAVLAFNLLGDGIRDVMDIKS